MCVVTWSVSSASPCIVHLARKQCHTSFSLCDGDMQYSAELCCASCALMSQHMLHILHQLMFHPRMTSAHKS